MTSTETNLCTDRASIEEPLSGAGCNWPVAWASMEEEGVMRRGQLRNGSLGGGVHAMAGILIAVAADARRGIPTRVGYLLTSQAHAPTQETIFGIRGLSYLGAIILTL